MAAYDSNNLFAKILRGELPAGWDAELPTFSGSVATRVASGKVLGVIAGKVPWLVDGDTIVWDSLAITEYLAERYPRVWPADAAARAWARCAAAEMHSGFTELRNSCTMNCGVRVQLKAFSAGLKSDIARIDALWNEGLSRFGGPFLAGPTFTAVDAFFAPVAFRVQTYGLALSPAARQYVDRMLALAPMQDWYAAALAEPWRDAEHEAELAQVGTVLQDLRAPCK